MSRVRSAAFFGMGFAPRFPAQRACVDLPWAILFLLTLIALIIFVATSAGELGELGQAPSRHLSSSSDGHGEGFLSSALGQASYGQGMPADEAQAAAFPSYHLSKSEAGSLLVTLCLACVAGAAGGLILATMWIMFAKTCASTMVYFSIYAIPTLLLVAGALVLVAGSVHGGIMLCLVGGLSLAFTFMCWAPYIPFTIEVIQMVAAAFSQNLEVVAISAVGGFLGPIWLVLVAVAYAAGFLKLSGGSIPEDSSDNPDGGLWYPFLFLLLWGSGVIQNVCHMAYSGVFSRWYFQQRESPLLSSLHVATVTSFGSICLGTMIIAAIQTVEAVVRSLRYAAEEDGNPVGCVIALILELIIGCIGDLMEYFSQWVFVMCAIRGGSFCDSARGTCALFSCAGMKGIIGDLLIDRVVTLGCLLAAVGGMGVAALAGFMSASSNDSMSRTDVIGLCALLGLFSAGISGYGVMAIMSSGTKAILMCWAEDPDRLHQEHGFGDLHAELNSKAREWK